MTVIDIVIYSIEIQKKFPSGKKYYEWGGFYSSFS